MIDTSIVRVHQHGACIVRNKRQSMGRSRGGLTSKIHAVVDINGLPVRLALTAGEAHDNRLAERLLSRLKSGTMLLADRGYDADWIRALVRQHGAWANIPCRSLASQSPTPQLALLLRRLAEGWEDGGYPNRTLLSPCAATNRLLAMPRRFKDQS